MLLKVKTEKATTTYKFDYLPVKEWDNLSRESNVEKMELFDEGELIADWEKGVWGPRLG